MKDIKELCKAVDKAFELETKLSISIQAVEALIVYQGFDDIEPQASMCSGGDFILEYRGSEIPIEQAIKLMKTRGYIKPCDFLIKL